MSPFRSYVMAVDRVEQRLLRVTRALDEAGVPYGVIGGNAVAAWVSRVDPGATRATKDVDLLVERGDLPRVDAVMSALGFLRHDLRRLVVYVDPAEPSMRAGVHLVWAEELIRTHYPCPAPSLRETARDPDGFLLLDLPALVRMKLTSFRDIDRVHVADLISVGLVDDAVRATLPSAMLERLRSIEDSIREAGDDA